MTIYPQFIIRPLRCLAAVLLLAATSSAWAHDPYEITATAYLRTNRLDLDVAMEFRTGLKLAGVEPQLPPGVSAADWFARNQTVLSACAKSFCDIQAGKDHLPVRSVTVALAVEDHIEFHIEYPTTTTERPLRFDATGLKTLAGQGEYGVALTVLDMVNSKVLGQPVLFADAPSQAAEVGAPAGDAVNPPVKQVAANVTPASDSQPASPDLTAVAKPSGGSWIVAILISGVAALLLLAMVWKRKKTKNN